jgi:NDP-sugar pyrophosphorylase family protein
MTMAEKIRDELILGVEGFFSLAEVPFPELFESTDYVWEALGRRDAFVQDHMRPGIGWVGRDGITIEGEVYIGEGTIIEPGAYIKGPTLIGCHCQIRHAAYIRGNVIIGDHCVVGHTTEVIRSILLNKVRADHFAYIGDSILGNNCHLGAGVVLANIKMRLSPSSVKIKINGTFYDTGMRKLGGILGDNSEIGCNSTVNPGTILGKGVTAYPGTILRGYYPSGTIVKT